jgi:hypothetical protein
MEMPLLRFRPLAQHYRQPQERLPYATSFYACSGCSVMFLKPALRSTTLSRASLPRSRCPGLSASAPGSCGSRPVSFRGQARSSVAAGLSLSPVPSNRKIFHTVFAGSELIEFDLAERRRRGCSPAAAKGRRRARECSAAEEGPREDDTQELLSIRTRLAQGSPPQNTQHRAEVR